MLMKNLFIFFLIPIIFSCSKSKPASANSEKFEKGIALADLSNNKIEEASGLAASINNPGLLWTQNDSGNPAEIFLIDTLLHVELTCKLNGIKNRDWEDITVGPGPDKSKSYIYVGDIGDNMARYQYKYIYRFVEPVLHPGENEILISDFDTITFQLPDAIKDTEALMINPLNKDLYIISKRERPVYLYKLTYPYSTNDTITATEVMSLPLSHIVAGDFSHDGKELLIKNYQNVYYWNIPVGETVEEALKEKPSILKYKEEPQGEAITFAINHSGFFTLSEKIKGEKVSLYFYKRNE
jgi:hypothetical protein